MEKCFVIQPFDKGKYDKRYNDTFVPAIRSAGLEAYRVDEDTSSIVLIETIDTQIRNASVCLADITTDNPNVWFEVGLAIAYEKDIVLICSDERTGNFPFDIRHRTIIKYTCESQSDFEKLKIEIKNKTTAFLQKPRKNAHHIISHLAQEQLSDCEITVLSMIAANSPTLDESTSQWDLFQEIVQEGYTKIAASLALKKLQELAYIKALKEAGDYNSQPYTAYLPTEEGFEWLDNNQDKLTLKIESSAGDDNSGDSNEEPFDINSIPF